MNMYFGILFLSILYYLDFRAFYKFERQLTRQTFAVQKVIILGFVLLGGVLFLILDKKWSSLVTFSIFYVTTFYLLRRHAMINFLKKETGSEDYDANELADDRAGDKKKLFIKLGAYGVLQYWTYGMMVILLILSGVVKLLGMQEDPLWDIIISTSISSFLFIILIYQAAKEFSGKNFSENVRLVSLNISAWRLYIVPMLVGLFFAVCSATILIKRDVQPETPLSEILGDNPSALVITFFLFLAVLIAPFIEEVIFRGYFYRVLRTFKGKIFSVFWIGSIFAILHMPQYWGDWLAIVMVTVLGFVLTYIREWSGSTISSVVMHYVYNAGVTIIPIVFLVTSNPAYFNYKAYPDHDIATKKQLLLTSIEKKPEFAEAYNDLAWIYAEEKIKLDEALVYIDKALSLEPNRNAFLDTKAEVLFQSGQIEESIKLRQEILEKKDLSKKMRDYIEEKITKSE